MTETIFVLVIGLLGLALGSFGNVLIHRVPAGESIVSPPSSCPACGHEIRARHNVPVVGWLWLRGQCADCGKKISPRYPIIEALMGTAFIVVALVEGLTWTLPLLLVLAFFSIVLSAVDFETYRLPDRLTLPFAIAVLITVAIAAQEVSDIIRAGLGALILGVIYFFAFLLYPRGMGFGDVKLALVLGAVLGVFGWSQLAVGGFAAFVWGSLVGIVVMAVRRQRKQVRIPFGPWMFAGAWTGLVVGVPLTERYLEISGLA